jgi:8-oxo-dGTP pyrophosphatase MutT (NUDIX family)
VAVTPRQTSCGVIVTDGKRILLGHATRSPRWDIPKGTADPGEDFTVAAVRELREETGLVAQPDELGELGVHSYLPGKDLALFVWTPQPLPNPRELFCTSNFSLPNGTLLPEFDRFELFPWDEALTRVGKNLARLLAALSLELLQEASK